jgi:hypothetical protein
MEDVRWRPVGESVLRAQKNVQGAVDSLDGPSRAALLG